MYCEVQVLPEGKLVSQTIDEITFFRGLLLGVIKGMCNFCTRAYTNRGH